MKLDQAQIAKVNGWFDSQGILFRCPICGNSQTREASLVVAPEWDGHPLLTGKAMPMVRLLCSKCFHAMFFAAGPMGIVQGKPSDER